MNFRKRIDRLKTERWSIVEGIRREKAERDRARDERDRAGQALDVARSVAEALQRDAHNRIAGLVTQCLKAVFGEDAYEFRILIEQKRGRTEARAVFVRDGEEYDALSSIGGGVVDVAAFALRIAILQARPDARRVLILDEPFRFLSSEYRPQIRSLLEALATDLGVQMIIVTHIEDLELGNVIRIGDGDGR